MANKYAAIWDALKKNKHVTLSIHEKLQPRVIRGVINLKDRDTVFKLEASASLKKYKIRYVAEAARVRIFLRESTDISSLTITDL